MSIRLANLAAALLLSAVGNSLIAQSLPDQTTNGSLVEVIAANTVSAASQTTPDFIRDIQPILSRYGCNGSGCHGKAEGQNGFKLSVFGFAPRDDYDAIVKEGRGRRVAAATPERSLFLQKVSGDLPHGGGIRLKSDSVDFQTIVTWIQNGMPPGDSAKSQVVKIEVTPHQQVLKNGAQQQMKVIATYADGTRIDATRLARFQSNNEAVATVDEHGMITIGDRPGQAAVMAGFMGPVGVFQILVPHPETPETWPTLPENNVIDRVIHTKLKSLNIVPSVPASDAEFLRRVYLDVIGTLPTADEARKFLADTDPQRRTKLVESLLDRDEYIDYWALKWSDLVRVDRETLGHQSAFRYYSWIRQSVAESKPYDRMLRELLTAEGPLSESPQGHFYQAVRKPDEIASTISQVFLGVRIECAQCHHHPFDRWSQQDFYGMQANFTQVKEKGGVRGSVLLAEGQPETRHPRTGEVVQPFGLGQEMPGTAPVGDRRRALADYLASAENPWFARNLANRLFAHFMGRGLVEPVDDFRETNPPTNPELLDAMAKHLVDYQFDAKAVIRLITSSAAYQRSATPNETNIRDDQNYSRAVFKRLPAEVLLDAVCQTTGVAEEFDSAPAGGRAIQLWDSREKHSFLRMFGRPYRVSACDCERNAMPSMGQVLHLMNAPEISRKLSHPAGTLALLTQETDDARLVDAIYLTFCSRYPADAERATAIEYLRTAADGRQAAAEDLSWGLMNSLEFVFNH